MKIKYIFLFLFMLITLFIISIYAFNDKINYLSLGDSLAEGLYYDGEIKEGYSDLIYNHYNKDDNVSFYTKAFSKSGYTSVDLLKDIKSDKHINIGNKKISLINAINEANVITLSIGANNFFRKLEDNIDKFDLSLLNNLEKYIDDVLYDIELLLIELRKYNNKDIIMIGYYNPLSGLSADEVKVLEPYFASINNKLKNICDKYDIHFVDIYSGFKNNSKEFLPNPLDIHPSKEGYQYIANRIIDVIDTNIIKK